MPLPAYDQPDFGWRIVLDLLGLLLIELCHYEVHLRRVVEQSEGDDLGSMGVNELHS